MTDGKKEGKTMIAIVIITTGLLVAAFYFNRWKRDQERRRLQEEELEAFLSLGDDGYSWQNVGKRQASVPSDPVPVIHTQIDGSAQVPGETWSSRLHRFK